jgi:hypothetical protein
VPPEAMRFKQWYVEVDGEKLSAKWVLSLVNGLPVREFKTGDARRELARLGLEPLSTSGTPRIQQTTPSVPELSREGFLRAILARLEGRLPAGVKNRPFNMYMLQLASPAASTHFELRLLKRYTEIALHFEGTRERNLAYLEQFRPHLRALGKRLKGPVYGEEWGTNYARVYLKHPPVQMDTRTAHTLADKWLAFVEATLPIVEDAIMALGLPIPAELHALSRSEFFQAVLARLDGRLPAGLESRPISANSYELRLNHPAPRTYYGLMLRKNYTGLSLIFYGPEVENKARLAPFEQALPDLQAKVGQPVYTHLGGSSYASVYLQLPPARLDIPTAQQVADTWLALIEATLPVLDRMVIDTGLKVRVPQLRREDLARPQAILAEEIARLRAYLQGDTSQAPSDEKLCDWVQFCYTFELLDEAVALFNLIRPEIVNPWLYDRARKLARACDGRLRLGNR